MRHFGRPGCLSFAEVFRGSADLDSFRAVAEGLTPLLDEVQFPLLSGGHAL